MCVSGQHCAVDGMNDQLSDHSYAGAFIRCPSSFDKATRNKQTGTIRSDISTVVLNSSSGAITKKRHQPSRRKSIPKAQASTSQMPDNSTNQTEWKEASERGSSSSSPTSGNEWRLVERNKRNSRDYQKDQFTCNWFKEK